MSDSSIKDVSDNAFMAAACRASETERPDALFRDPLAAKLAGEQGRRIIESLPKKAFIGGWTVVIRTRIIDDFIQSAIADGIETVLNLGAGLDARPYRMALPRSLRRIEVDYPHVKMREARPFSSFLFYALFLLHIAHPPLNACTNNTSSLAFSGCRRSNV